MPGETSTSLLSPKTYQNLFSRYRQFRLEETHKNDLIEELLAHVKSTESMYQQAIDALNFEIKVNRSARSRELELENTVQQLKDLMAVEPYVLLLIDGNQYFVSTHPLLVEAANGKQTQFQDAFIQQGEAGGRAAADDIWEATVKYIGAHPDVPPEAKVIIRIYANVERLRGCLKHGSLLKDFMRGFTTVAPLFDFMDVPADENIVEEKIAAVFQLHLNNYHCRRILFGSGRGSRYSDLLYGSALNPQNLDRITFLEVTDDTQEQIPGTSSFNELFRTFGPEELQESPPSKSPQSEHTSASMHGPSLSPTNFPGLPLAQVASVSGSITSNSPAPTWAFAVSKGSNNVKPLVFPSAKVPMVTSLVPGTISRNRKGQRIDPPIPCTRDESQRVKDLKLCNTYFLRQDCPHGKHCTHVHKYSPSKVELQILRHVARMAPCKDGSACEDVKCIYGHVCPAQAGKYGEKCIHGLHCRYPSELHGLDTKVVKGVKR